MHTGSLCILRPVSPTPQALLHAQQLLGSTPGCAENMHVDARQQQTLSTVAISCAISRMKWFHGLVIKILLSNNIDEADLSRDR